MALLQAWWRRTFPVDGHLSVDDLVRGKLEREAPSEVDAEVFLEELGKPAFETELDEVDGSVAAALLRTWWRGRVPDPDGWWTQSVLDSGDAFWWRESETAEGGMEVRLNDPRNASSEAEGGGAGDGSAWTSGMLESGAPARSKWPLGSAQGSARAPPRGAPGGSGQLGTPRARPSHWAPRRCLCCLGRA